ncbi:MAG TPA: hypothetical protein VM511_05690 [Luteolibacter sp.]|nr:hypothetical protein [Luteolibacter sp.]
MKFFLGTLMGIVALAAAEPNSFPYDEFTKFSEKMPGEKIGDALVIAAYLKPRTAGEKIDLAVANFRIQMPDGKVVPLKCEQLPVVPEGVTNENDKKKIAVGFTHKLWIPKDPAKYAGAAMLNDLPKDFLEIQFPLPPREE